MDSPLFHISFLSLVSTLDGSKHAPYILLHSISFPLREAGPILGEERSFHIRPKRSLPKRSSTMAFGWKLVDHLHAASQSGQGARAALPEVWAHLYVVAWFLAMYSDKQNKGGPRVVVQGKNNQSAVRRFLLNIGHFSCILTQKRCQSEEQSRRLAPSTAHCGRLLLKDGWF